MFAEGDAAVEATREGADIVGGKELIQEIKQSGKADFEAAIATPDMMKHLAVVAKVLGPKGLMPSPKNDTVTNNVGVAIKDIKRGKVSFKNDVSGNVHQVIGKRSFDAAMLFENYTSFMDALQKSKPAASKGIFIRNISLSTSMGPGIKIELS